MTHLYPKMETLIIQSSDKPTLDKIKEFLGTLKVTFKVEQAKQAEEEESPYDPEFVKMVLERAKSAKEGNTVVYTDNLRKELFGK